MVDAGQQLALFDAAELPAPAVDDGSLIIATDGLAHFRHLISKYGQQWPKDVRRWSAWVDYFERMRTRGYEAAQVIKPLQEFDAVDVWPPDLLGPGA